MAYPRTAYEKSTGKMIVVNTVKDLEALEGEWVLHKGQVKLVEKKLVPKKPTIKKSVKKSIKKVK